MNNVGPGSYQLNSDRKKHIHTVQPAFTSNEQRFINSTPVDLTPGPGYYQAKSIANELQSKVSSKGGVFGSRQKRFVGDSHKESLPGPGQYTTSLIN
jgi:hypothetical protein